MTQDKLEESFDTNGFRGILRHPTDKRRLPEEMSLCIHSTASNDAKLSRTRRCCAGVIEDVNSVRRRAFARSADGEGMLHGIRLSSQLACPGAIKRGRTLLKSSHARNIGV